MAFDVPHLVNRAYQNPRLILSCSLFFPPRHWSLLSHIKNVRWKSHLLTQPCHASYSPTETPLVTPSGSSALYTQSSPPPHIFDSSPLISLTIGRVMASSSTSSDCENTKMDVDETSTTVQHDLTSREGQFLQGVTSLQQQLDVMSQRQDELMEIIGVLREQQEE